MSRMRTALAAALLALTVAASAGGTALRPSVRFASLQPTTIRGNGFVPRERVRVVLNASGTRETRLVRASAAGAFTATFGDTFLDPCNDSAWVSAIGGHGDRAGAKLPQRLCPPSLTPP